MKNFNETKNTTNDESSLVRRTNESTLVRRTNESVEEKNSRKTNDSIPNKAFDLEYSTQFKREYYFLKEHKINPTIVKKTKDYGIPTYKYTKTPELFIALSAFYAELRNERLFNKYEKLTNLTGKNFSTLEEAKKYIESETGKTDIVSGLNTIEDN